VEALRVVRHRSSQISLENRLLDGSGVVSLMSRPLIPSGMIPATSFLLEAECGMEGVDRLEIALTSSGIECTTFWLRA
jgi:hypothetical protein